MVCVTVICDVGVDVTVVGFVVLRSVHYFFLICMLTCVCVYSSSSSINSSIRSSSRIRSSRSSISSIRINSSSPRIAGYSHNYVRKYT